MAIFRCKMCGGTFEIGSGSTVATCEYCGTQQTLPKLDDDRRVNLYDRANHFRRNNEFDKAATIYEQILSEDTADAEAYWSLVLCHYGIEYVEDPATRKRVPTVNRAQFTSIFNDDNYRSALQHSDSYQRSIYEAEAKAINEIQKGILAISQKEEPFDVFICYKETDTSGRRTHDSVLANELYHQLTQEGFKVFFSRITLEDKLGSAYEPYIFAALNSAKVMVVLGTRPEFFNAVWVKNEWSRYLALIRSGAKKTLIPAYKDMDPYDLPEEFSHLQAQDMSKLGFMQDLIRGIKKILDMDAPKATAQAVTATGVNTSALIKRAFLFAEDRDWENANAYCEKVLDENPEDPQAYLVKLLIELRATSKEALQHLKTPFDGSSNYTKVIRYADPALKQELEGYNADIRFQAEQQQLEAAYTKALTAKRAAKSEQDFRLAAQQFLLLKDYKDAAGFAEQCQLQAEQARQESIWLAAQQLLNRGYTGQQQLSCMEKAREKLLQIPQYKNAQDQASQLDAQMQELKKQLRLAAKKRKRTAVITFSVIAACIIIGIALYITIPLVQYNNAAASLEAGQYDEAIAGFTQLGDYRDASEQVIAATYAKGNHLIAEGDYDAAEAIFLELGNYSDSSTRLREIDYLRAYALYDAKQYKEAYKAFQAIPSYKDSKELAKESGYLWASALLEAKDYEAAYHAFKEIPTYSDSTKKYKEATYQYALSLKKPTTIVQAASTFALIEGYADATEQMKACYLEAAQQFQGLQQYILAFSYYKRADSTCRTTNAYKECAYQAGLEHLKKSDFIDALAAFQEAGNYSDAKKQILATKYAYVKANLTRSNSLTHTYLQELKKAKYMDSATIFKELYAWKVKIVMNDSETNTTTDKTSISKYGNFYVHIELTGGEPNATTKLRCVGYFPNGSTSTVKWDGEWADNYSGKCWFYYNNPQYGKAGTFTVKVYDAAGNVIGQDSIRIS